MTFRTITCMHFSLIYNTCDKYITVANITVHEKKAAKSVTTGQKQNAEGLRPALKAILGELGDWETSLEDMVFSPYIFVLINL